MGIVELEFESTSALVLLLFVIPLAFTLSGFLMWILYSLNGQCSCLSFRVTLTESSTPQPPSRSSRQGSSATSSACSNGCTTSFYLLLLSLPYSSSSRHYRSLAVLLKVRPYRDSFSRIIDANMVTDYAAKTWKVRWWRKSLNHVHNKCMMLILLPVLDGWLALLYLVAFTSIAYLWRPSEHNRR